MWAGGGGRGALWVRGEQGMGAGEWGCCPPCAPAHAAKVDGSGRLLHHATALPLPLQEPPPPRMTQLRVQWGHGAEGRQELGAAAAVGRERRLVHDPPAASMPFGLPVRCAPVPAPLPFPARFQLTGRAPTCPALACPPAPCRRSPARARGRRRWTLLSQWCAQPGWRAAAQWGACRRQPRAHGCVWEREGEGGEGGGGGGRAGVRGAWPTVTRRGA